MKKTYSHEIDSPAKKTSGEPHKNDLAEGSEDDDKKKKKKRSQKKSDLDNLITEEEPMSEGYMGGRMASECPLLDGIEKKCRGIDIMSGDAQHYMLEACGAHQLCYLCVSLTSLSNWVSWQFKLNFNSIGRFTAAVRLRVFERSRASLWTRPKVQDFGAPGSVAVERHRRQPTSATRMHPQSLLEHGDSRDLLLKAAKTLFSRFIRFN